MKQDLDLLHRNTVGDLLRKNARKFSDKTAITCFGEKLTFAELNALANRFANGLRQLGLKKGDTGGVLCSNSMSLAIAMWGFLKANVTATFVNTNLVAREISYQVNHSDSKIFFVEDSFADQILNIKDELKKVELFGYVNINNKPVPEDWINIEELYSNKYSDEEPEVEISDDDIAFRLYTSGTTSLPKGIDLMYKNLEYIAHSWARSSGGGLDVDEVSGYFTPLYHSANLHFIAPICLGSHVVIGYLGNLEGTIETIEKEKVNFTCFPVTIFGRLLNSPLKQKLRSLKKIWWFGGAMPLDVLKGWFDSFPDINIIAQWSQTECLVGTLTAFNKDTGLPRAGNVIGRPYLDTEIKIVDPNDEEVPDGEPGEIVMRSPAVMKGYCKNDEATKEAFRTGWHHTGDVGVKGEDGNYYFVDRVKDMIKTGGVNVSAMEVEAAINSMDGVETSAAFGLAHPDWIEAVAAAVVRKDQELTEEKIIKYCKQNIAKFKVPKKIIFVDEIPISHVGKILRKDLREQYKDLFVK
jgi:fatty-acyl-CoA synthase